MHDLHIIPNSISSMQPHQPATYTAPVQRENTCQGTYHVLIVILLWQRTVPAITQVPIWVCVKVCFEELYVLPVRSIIH